MVAPLNITDHSKPFNDEVYTSTGELIDTRITKNITDTYLTYFDTTAEFTGDKCQHSVGECIEHKYEFRAFISLLHECTQDKQFRQKYLVVDLSEIWMQLCIIVFERLQNRVGKTERFLSIKQCYIKKKLN